MRWLLFEEHTEVKCVPVLGSQAAVDSGVGSTARTPGTCDPGWFVGENSGDTKIPQNSGDTILNS